MFRFILSVAIVIFFQVSSHAQSKANAEPFIKTKENSVEVIESKTYKSIEKKVNKDIALKNAKDFQLKAVKKYELTTTPELRKDIIRTLQYLHSKHYLPHQLNDDYSSRALDAYLESLDPNKIYFQQADIDAFRKRYRYRLDDVLKQGNAEPAFEIFRKFRHRLSARTVLALNLIKKDFDFTTNETIVIDPEQMDWAKDADEMKKRWALRIKNDVLTQLLSDTPIADVRDNLTRRYKRQKNLTFQLNSDEVFERFINAYMTEIEPHTQYMTHISGQNFRISLSLSLQGIGASLRADQDYTVINRLIPGGPAEASKLLDPEDKIVGVGQKGEEIVNVIGWRLMDVVQLIRGKKGTEVTLKIQKHNDLPGSPPVTIQLERDIIQLKEQAAKLSDVNINEGGKKHLFSVIHVPSFYSNAGKRKFGEEEISTTNDVAKLLKQINESKSEGLIIDLRGNGGGFLHEAVALTGLFIPRGPVVQEVFASKYKQIRKDKDGKIAYDGPMIVLIDRYSASASEIFAAALQDYGRAIIVGERSFGKGTVQGLAPLRDNDNTLHESKIKYTVAQFFRINGGSTQHKGVIPDIKLNAGIEDKEFGERSYETAIPWSRTTAANYSAATFAPEMLTYMQLGHLDRSINSPALSFLRKNSETLTHIKGIKELSLNLKQRRKEKDALDKKTLAQFNAYRASLGLKPVTSKTKKDNPLPDEDEHWNIVFHTEAAKILHDQNKWTSGVVAKQRNQVVEMK